MLGVPSNLIFSLHSSLKIRFRWSKVLQQCICVCVSLHFFAMRTAKADVQRDVFPIVTISILIFCNASNLCIISAIVYTGFVFIHCQRIMFCSSENAMFGPCSAASRSSVFFYTVAAKRRSAKQWHIFREDVTSEQSKTARTKTQQHCSRDTPTHAPHST